MLPHHSDLEQLLDKKKKSELVQTISNIYQLSHGKVAWELFSDLAYECQLKALNAAALRQEVETFYLQSISGKYYAPHGGDFRNIPEETEEWFYEISLLLDLCCELAFRKESITAKFCFDRLLGLFDRIGDDEIVFAHETGEWMLCCRHRFKDIYETIKTGHSL